MWNSGCCCLEIFVYWPASRLTEQLLNWLWWRSRSRTLYPYCRLPVRGVLPVCLFCSFAWRRGQCLLDFAVAVGRQFIALEHGGRRSSLIFALNAVDPHLASAVHGVSLSRRRCLLPRCRFLARASLPGITRLTMLRFFPTSSPTWIWSPTSLSLYEIQNKIPLKG